MLVRRLPLENPMSNAQRTDLQKIISPLHDLASNPLFSVDANGDCFDQPIRLRRNDRNDPAVRPEIRERLKRLP